MACTEKTVGLIALFIVFFCSDGPRGALAQPGVGSPPPPNGRGAPPRLRFHEVIQSDGNLQLVPADVAAVGESQTTMEIVGDKRVIRSNGIPLHNTGAFPNPTNPNTIRPQTYIYSIPSVPKKSGNITPLRGSFGVYINGGPLDLSAAEFFHGDRLSGWQYEALSGALPLGLDASHAHVQPTGAYHYHAKPTLLLLSMGLISTVHSPLVGWAADGFPIYAIYGYTGKESSVSKLRPSYKIKAGNRPVGDDEPGPVYDGTFTRNYEYVEGKGDLDKYNGMWTSTPEYPDGTYTYFLTNEWPYVPRCHKGTPSENFAHGGVGEPSTTIWRGSWGRIKRLKTPRRIVE